MQRYGSETERGTPWLVVGLETADDRSCPSSAVAVYKTLSCERCGSERSIVSETVKGLMTIKKNSKKYPMTQITFLFLIFYLISI